MTAPTRVFSKYCHYQQPCHFQSLNFSLSYSLTSPYLWGLLPQIHQSHIVTTLLSFCPTVMCPPSYPYFSSYLIYNPVFITLPPSSPTLPYPVVPLPSQIPVKFRYVSTCTSKQFNVAGGKKYIYGNLLSDISLFKITVHLTPNYILLLYLLFLLSPKIFPNLLSPP